MKRILVIENDPDILENVIEMLELLEYRVFGANNGKEGVRLTSQESPDLIICDIKMPEMDGYELLKIIRLELKYDHIPFIVLTAMSESSDVQKALALGANKYVIKPFEENELLDAVKSSLLTS